MHPTQRAAERRGKIRACGGRLLLFPSCMTQMLLLPDPRPLVELLGAEFFRQAPERPGIYLMLDSKDTVLYVGKAKNLKKRLGNYRVANPDRLPRRHLRLLRAVHRIELRECADEAGALASESELLRSLRPRFNRAGTWPGRQYVLLWQVTNDAVVLAVSQVSSDGPAQPSPALRDHQKDGARTFLSASSPDIIAGRRLTEGCFPFHVAADGNSDGSRAGAGAPDILAPRPLGALERCAGGSTLTFSCHGPLGTGAFQLRGALVRLLWCLFHPERGLAGMPDGWFYGRFGELTTITRPASLPLACGSLPDSFSTAAERMEGLFSGQSAEFADWVREHTSPALSRFDLAIVEEDLEMITGSPLAVTDHKTTDH
ncbi:MAG: hypothetical protein C5B50_16700 [Verrucomicrobia bacterium]|nr:MAG: hypothetical protein C5B50_16700 [Verrucomicrobiota bacterium]